MRHKDSFDLTLSAADAAALPAYESAVTALLLLRGDPVAMVDAATGTDPSLVMGHVLKGLLCLLGTEKSLLADAAAALATGQALAGSPGGANSREKTHLAALTAWLAGSMHQACDHWESILIEQPSDALAMFAAHQGDFLLGRSSELRDRVARRLPDIARGGALEGYYLGMHAFGLEEMGDYARAEECGRRAVQIEARNAWAIHAVTHVMEMENRVDEGIDWLDSRVEQWAPDNFFAVHNWWHLALFHMDRQHWDEVLALYDQRIRASGSTTALDMLDASALLWRLSLHGVNLGQRWQSLAQAWEPRIDDSWYAFNDYHAMMAFAGAGREDLAQRLLTAMQRAATQDGENGAVTREVALPIARALLAFARGEHAAAAGLLSPVRAIAARAGGSHAQRDLLGQTLLAAAERAGQRALARALLNERLSLRPRSELNLGWMARFGPSH